MFIIDTGWTFDSIILNFYYRFLKTDFCCFAVCCAMDFCKRDKCILFLIKRLPSLEGKRTGYKDKRGLEIYRRKIYCRSILLIKKRMKD